MRTYRSSWGCRTQVPLLAGCLLATWMAAGVGARAEEFTFHNERVLGTSFDLKVRGATREQAEDAEQAALVEIQRLGGILWTGNPKSEIARLAKGQGTVACSPDLFAVLSACDLWRIRTFGAFNPYLGELVDLWAAAGKAGALPDSGKISDALATLRKPAWRLLRSSRQVRLLRPPHLRVEGLAKGYVIDRALAAARGAAGSAKGILLDIGGDIAVWTAPGSKESFVIDIADPAKPADNARPLTAIQLSSGAVATSGGYARGVKIGGKLYSHIIDPHTGKPAEGVASATVVAPDAVSADAAATALCVLMPLKGRAIVSRLAHTECLIVDAKGSQWTTSGWKRLVAESALPAEPASPAGGAAWPSGYAVSVRLNLANNRKRPYVAAWVADEKGRPVRMLALWGRKSKYLRKLSAWARLSRAFQSTARNVTRASRSAGNYSLTWDGRDHGNRPVGKGSFTICIEIAREKGSHVLMSGTVRCGTGTPDSASMRGNTESGGASVRYGKD